MVSSAAVRDQFWVEYFDGCNDVRRYARCIGHNRYLVIDRYDDGTECIISQDHQIEFNLVDCVRLLEEVRF